MPAPWLLQTRWLVVVFLASLTGVLLLALLQPSRGPGVAPSPAQPTFHPRKPIDPTGYNMVTAKVPSWPPDASLPRIADCWQGVAVALMAPLDTELARPTIPSERRVAALVERASLLNYDGHAEQAYETLEEARTAAGKHSDLDGEWRYTIVYLQGLSALRRGETENCILCRGESSCILPLAPSARHSNQTGSRQAVKHFTEYLERFPDDLPVRWLLNVAHMTLGEYPDRVDPRFRLSLEKYNHPDHAIGRFREIGSLVGLARLNMAGGAILDDFHNTGRLDLVFTSMDPAQPLAFYRNNGDGTYEERATGAGLGGQLGGLGCVQGDYDNDGHLDLFVMRGAWLKTPMRPSLLRNNGDGTFTDVTEKAGLSHAMNTDTAQWADYDNDGHLDLFVCGEAQPSRLYRNNGDGTFGDVATKAGLGDLPGMWKGCSWFDYDGDGFLDLFLNNYTGPPRLFRNDRTGSFTDVTERAGISGPKRGLSCWTWDYDNDGWPDLFATSYDRTPDDLIRGLLGQPHGRDTSRLYRNLGGKGFADVTADAGVGDCFSAMGTNFGDLDNDGWLDFYLGTGDHDIATLVPNRLFRNLAGKRFVDVSSSSGTGHLQKGHGVCIGDYDRDGSADLAVQMGGAIPGDRYHNVLFRNPGQGNNWLNVKLTGKKTNRAAIGAKIKAVTAGANPQTLYRTVCSGSSFGGNPLEQLLGLGKADRVAVLEVTWPTSGATQTFRDLPANQAIEITEFATEVRVREYKPFAPPK